MIASALPARRRPRPVYASTSASTVIARYEAATNVVCADGPPEPDERRGDQQSSEDVRALLLSEVLNTAAPRSRRAR